MNCPVCNTTELSDDTANCPQCKSDLEVFRLIVEASEQRQKHKKIISALGLFAAVTAIGWASVGIFSGKSSVPGPIELSPEVTVQNSVRPAPGDSELIAMLSKENESLKSENTSLAAKITSLDKKSEKVSSDKVAHAEKVNSANAKSISSKAAETNESGTIIHTVKNGDTFWIIARKYFHDGRKYKQIAKDNGMSPKQKLSKGMKLKIQK